MLALLILGQIAAFSIPKVLNAQQSGQKKAVFRETIAAITNAQHISILQGELNKSTAPSVPILAKLNGTKVCNTNAASQNCWSHTWSGPYSEETEPGLIFHNGATVAGIKNAAIARGNDLIIIDWNGPKGPNIQGDDQLFMALCYDKTGTGYSGYCVRSNVDNYVDYARDGNQAAHQALWNWIFGS